jgi:hypothetical protein
MPINRPESGPPITSDMGMAISGMAISEARPRSPTSG